MTQTVDTVVALYDAFARRDNDSIRRLFHPDIEWIQMDGWPMGGRHIGTEKVINEVFATFRTHWDDWRAVVEEYLDAGRVVVALGYYTGRSKGSGKPVRSAFAHVYTVDGGRIVKFVQYADTLRVAEALAGPGDIIRQ